MKPPKCIDGGEPPCPSCPVSRVCPWGAELLIHTTESLNRKCLATDRALRRRGQSTRLLTAVVLLLATVAFGKTRPPVLDPNVCPAPYDLDVVSIAQPMSWLPADVNVSVVSQINVWNRTGRDTVMTIEQVVEGGNGYSIVPIAHTILPNVQSPVPDPNGGYNKSWTWGITPTESRIYYVLMTAGTPSKPAWKVDRRIVLVYVEAEDTPVIWVQNIGSAELNAAKRVWQAAAKAGRPMSKPMWVRLAHD